MKVIAMVLACAALVVASGVAAFEGDGSRAAPGRGAAPVAGYRGWTRVNPKPHYVPPKLAFLCRGATREEIAEEIANPHLGKWVTVYVNGAGRRAMLSRKRPTFPRGSLLVKEKHPDPASKTPELLTAMRKREKGYDPAGGDWEYLVLDGDGGRVQSRGRLAACRSCHARWKATDYVSRAYLPADARRGLR